MFSLAVNLANNHIIDYAKEAIKEFKPMQACDVTATWADVEDLAEAVGFRPNAPIELGIRKFISWFRK